MTKTIWVTFKFEWKFCKRWMAEKVCATCFPFLGDAIYYSKGRLACSAALCWTSFMERSYTLQQQNVKISKPKFEEDNMLPKVENINIWLVKYSHGKAISMITVKFLLQQMKFHILKFRNFLPFSSVRANLISIREECMGSWVNFLSWTVMEGEKIGGISYPITFQDVSRNSKIGILSAS